MIQPAREARACSRPCHDRLSGVFGSLTRQGALIDEDIARRRCARSAWRCSRPTSRCRSRATSSQRSRRRPRGQAVTKSVTPGQQVVKIVHDALIDVLRGEGEPGALRIDNPPAPILMVGLQGSRQDHHHREARQAPAGARGQARADGLARHPPAGGDGAARHPRHPGRRRYPADRHRAGRRCRSPDARNSRRRSAATTSVMLDTAGRLHDRRRADGRGRRGRATRPARTRRCWWSTA